MDYFNSLMKSFVLVFFLFLTSSVMAQSLRDSLYGGKLKADTGKIVVSKDTGKYVAPKVYNIPAQVATQGQVGENKKAEIIKLDESMPDSLNKNFYAKQKTWKRFIDINAGIISQQADDTKKVKKGIYSIEIEYEIGVNGRVKTNAITCDPPNEFLLEQFTELMKRTPVLSPAIYSDGKPKALTSKQSVTITKK